jgi:hypothetical protein
MTEVISYCHINNAGVYKNGESLFKQDHKLLADLAGAIYTWLGIDYPRIYKMDMLSKFGVLACEVLLLNTGKRTETSIVLSNASSCLDTDLNFYESMAGHPSPSLFVYTLPNIVAGEICIRNGFKGESIFFISPAFDAELLSTYVEMVFAAEGNAECVAGWVEVLNGRVDVFLYLAGRSSGRPFAPHSPATILDLYLHGKINA